MPEFRSGMPGLFLGLAADKVVASGGTIPFDLIEWSEEWPGVIGGVATVPREGTYMVTCRFTRLLLATAPTSTISLRRNGADTEASYRAPASTAEIRFTISALVRAALGDTLSVVAVTSSGVAQTFFTGRTTMRIARIGPKKWT